MASKDLPVEELQLFTNGRDQKLRRWCLPDINSPKAICIMVHGIGDHIFAYEDIAKALEKHNVALHGYDQVGHGKSEGAKVDIKDFQHYVNDLLQFTTIIKSEYAGLPIFIIGHSMGGLVLGHTLLRKPDLCDGVIMYAAAIDANPQVITPFKVTMAKLLSRLIPSFPVGGVDDDVLTRSKQEVQRLKVDPLRHHGKLKARWGHNTLKALIDLNDRLSEISIPVFIAHGKEDMVCHIDGSTKFNDIISSKDKTYKMYDRCYHRIHTEPDGDGELFIADICDWINNRCEAV